jgi:hypothetical protein
MNRPNQTETSKDPKATTNVRILVRDVPRLAALGERCEHVFGGSYSQQHTLEKALNALERELQAEANPKVTA